eukprot:CAMPEP_0168219598 /NCGR_PEP_ID=MMETSP0140_2-20121125/8680_1 /TAXON_ID=44445 /ORGANISM="Pseudo-nitzschia australis, Strain 10249 10 AB" /LENGTH=200 /DNA_ID=CAMNT_0008148059 /DNA_START=323 /DNA_END=926 /DNA_ORIENTATION=-
MMNFAALVLALAAVTPFVSAEYTCHGDTSFQFSDDSISDPLKQAIEYLGKAMVDSFQEAYKNNNDIDMTSEKFDSFDVGPNFASIVNTVLRGAGSTNLQRGGGRYVTEYWWGCNLCVVDDDAVALGTSIDGPEFGMALTTSIEHKNWEKLFCEKASNLKKFSSMTDCSIVLSNCHKESASDVKAKSFVKQVKTLVNSSSN